MLCIVCVDDVYVSAFTTPPSQSELQCLDSGVGWNNLLCAVL